MLVIANPYATTVSARLKSLVVYALQGRYDVDTADTEGRDHATALCRDAAAAGYRKAVRHWIATAKRPATRIARAEQLVAESAAGRLVPFARPGKTPAWLVRAAAAAAAVEG